MLTLYHNGEQYPIQDTEYYIRELADGLDEIIFTLDIHDPIYAILAEEEQIVDRAGQTYKVKQIDAGARDAKVVCQLDIDDWRATLNVGYNSGSKTVSQQLDAVRPTGWTINDRSNINISRTIEGDFTPYDVCVRCTEVYNVYIRWNNKTKECTIYPKAKAAPVGAFATRELNLKEINYKGKSNDLITRLYCYGKDGLTLEGATIDEQVYPYPYVDDFTYTNKIICGIWRDERYTVVEDLYEDAVEKLAIMSKPDRTYECSIVDLQATNPELYNNLDFSLFTTATLIDDIKETAVDYQVVERHIYPYHPDKNEVIFNSEPLKITASVVNIVESLDNPSSVFNQIQAQRIATATNWLLSGDGYVVAVKGSNGEWKELLFMDQPDMDLAEKVLRINENGIGFSTHGVNGPYANAWTIDGQLVADFITTGTLTASLIKAGILTDLNGKFSLNMEDGTLNMQDGTFEGTITGSTISGSTITTEAVAPATGRVVISGGLLHVYDGSSGYFYVTNASDTDCNLALGGKYFAAYNGGVYYGDYETIYIGKAAADAGGASDRSHKKNIETLDKDMSRAIIRNSRPVSFEYIPEKGYHNEHGRRFGLIAQELRKVLDQCGAGDVELEYERWDGVHTIEYKELIAHLINTTQDLYNEIDSLKAEINKLKEAVNG